MGSHLHLLKRGVYIYYITVISITEDHDYGAGNTNSTNGEQKGEAMDNGLLKILKDLIKIFS